MWPDRRRWHCDNGDGDKESDGGASDVDGIGDSPLKEEIAELKYLVIDNDIISS